MGYPTYPVYSEDIGSAVEDVEKILSKIKNNSSSIVISPQPNIAYKIFLF